MGDIIVAKIRSDLQALAGTETNDTGVGGDKVVIKPTLEVFYPSVTGFGWLKCQVKLRMHFLVTVNDKEVLNKTYEKIYITSGNDKGYEGSIVDTIENCANIAIGMCLRMTLDEFYLDLKSSIN